MWSYRNPVEIRFGQDALEAAGRYLAGSRYALVTYGGSFFGEAVDRIVREAGPPERALSDIAENPDVTDLAARSDAFERIGRDCEVILALGGGSVLDAAKAIALTRGETSRLRRFPESDDLDQAALPLVAVPTTAGTGSELTCWATMWDRERRRKLSIEHPTLFPRAAFVDPALTLSAPRRLTISTGLDALSHALESIWNINANPISRASAVQAARTILDILPRLADDLGNPQLRARMSEASLLAGIAFSNTRTALAHSISYPITLQYGVPHGIASSFTLPSVMEWAAGADEACDAALRAIFEAGAADAARALADFLQALDVSTDHRDYGITDEDFSSLVASGAEGVRGRNYLGKVPDSR